MYFGQSMNKNRSIGQWVEYLPNGQGDLISIPGQVIPMTQKMELEFYLLNSQHYNVGIKGKVERSSEKK